MDPHLKELLVAGFFTGGGAMAVWAAVKAVVAYLAKQRESRLLEGRADAKDWGQEYKSLYESTKERLDEMSIELEQLRKRAFAAEERSHRGALEAQALQKKVEELLVKNRRLTALADEKEAMLKKARLK